MYSFIAQFNSTKLQLTTCIWLFFFSGSHKLSTAEHASSYGTSKYGRNVFNVSFGFKNNSYNNLFLTQGWDGNVFWVKVIGRCKWPVVNLDCLCLLIFNTICSNFFFPVLAISSPNNNQIFFEENYFRSNRNFIKFSNSILFSHI